MFKILIGTILLLGTVSSGWTTNEIVLGTATVSNNVMTIPIEITNQDSLIAIDIALKYSDGVKFKSGNFEGSRVAYFDLNTFLQLPEVENTVIVSCVWQLSTVPRQALPAGTGLVATLVFDVTGSNAEVTVEPTETVMPRHCPMFVYGGARNDGRRQQIVYPRVRRDFSVEVIDIPSTLPKRLELLQNYPNPFNPTTTIEFSLPTRCQVKLDVYNILGQCVESLIFRLLPAGVHAVNWDATSIANGMYFYKITADGVTITKKMIVLK